MERRESSLGMPFISISMGMVTSRSISSAACPGHCVMISTCGGREIRVGVDGQLLEGHRAPDHEGERGDHDQESLPQGEGDKFRDHSICALLNAVGELEEEAAIGHDGFPVLQAAGDGDQSVLLAGRWQPGAARTFRAPSARRRWARSYRRAARRKPAPRGVALRIRCESRRRRTCPSSACRRDSAVTMRTGVVRVLGSRKEPM